MCKRLTILFIQPNLVLIMGVGIQTVCEHGACVCVYLVCAYVYEYACACMCVCMCVHVHVGVCVCAITYRQGHMRQEMPCPVNKRVEYFGPAHSRDRRCSLSLDEVTVVQLQ